jgi:hypothetical protein
MKFGEALEVCRQGKLIYRTGWNGRNQFVFYQEGAGVLVEDLRCAAFKQWAQKDARIAVEFMGYLAIKTTSNIVQCGWLATQSDMQAEDWEVLE